MRKTTASWANPRGAASTGVLIACLCAVPFRIEAAPLRLAEFARLARQCAPNVAVSTLAAIARTESGFDPFALSDNTVRISGAPASASEAIGIASRLIAAGHSVDVGLMQVNSANFAALGLTVATALDRCQSIAAGAAILTGGYDGGRTHATQQAALRVAISRYNTGDPVRGFANGYVQKVELSNARIVPALDVNSGPTAGEPSVPLKPVAASGWPAGPPSWEIFPPDANPAAGRGGTAQRTTIAEGTLTLADAGKGPAAAVTNYPGPSDTHSSEAP